MINYRVAAGGTIFLVLVLALLALLISTSGGQTAEICHSLASARKLAPNSHLYYKRVGGEQCWYAPGIVSKPTKAPAAKPKATKPKPRQLIVDYEENVARITIPLPLPRPGDDFAGRAPGQATLTADGRARAFATETSRLRGESASTIFDMRWLVPDQATPELVRAMGLEKLRRCTVVTVILSGLRSVQCN